MSERQNNHPPGTAVGVDIGGTFTDFVVYDPEAGYRTFKVLSTPDDPSRAVLEGLARLGKGPKRIVHGSTVATNALLERKGARTAFIATAGFRDLLRIGRQNRPELYALEVRKPEPLAPPELCLEVAERVSANGEVITPLSDAEIERVTREVAALQVESVAICLLHAYLRPEHEAALAGRLRQTGVSVSVSSEILPEMREYERASTTMVNAYLGPVMERYLSRLAAGVGDAPLRIMQSNGGALSATEAGKTAVRCVLSGPAGGVLGVREIVQTGGYGHALTFDMGGTSTDTALVLDEIQLTTETEIGGCPLRVPMIDIQTVGAGGGSLAFGDPGGALRVGPDSAGADPGPACYGRGGTRPTVTDANLVLGRLPHASRLGGELPLDVTAATAALERLAEELGLAARDGLSAAQVAARGVIEVVNAGMERALRGISVERGHDPADFTLVCFGGAGGLHAAELARALGIQRVLVPHGAGTLSAFGMLRSHAVRDYVQTVLFGAAVSVEELRAALQPLEAQAREDLAKELAHDDELRLEPALDVRYRGQSYELTVPLDERWRQTFHALHERRYGYRREDELIEVVNVRLRATALRERPPMPGTTRSGAGEGDARPAREWAVAAEGIVESDIYDGNRIAAGAQTRGPAVLVLSDTTIWVPPGCDARIEPAGHTLIEVP